MGVRRGKPVPEGKGALRPCGVRPVQLLKFRDELQPKFFGGSGERLAEFARSAWAALCLSRPGRLGAWDREGGPYTPGPASGLGGPSWELGGPTSDERSGASRSPPWQSRSRWRALSGGHRWGLLLAGRCCCLADRTDRPIGGDPIHRRHEQGP